jgi:hypothetical protein
MNWQRGLLLAGIHLVVAGTFMVWEEAHIAQFFENHSIPHEQHFNEPGQPSEPEGERAYIDPCKMSVTYSSQTKIVQFANLPSAALIEWPSICPDRWSLAGLLHLSRWQPSIAGIRRFDFTFACLIPLQWFFIGGFPLVRPRRWWWESGAFITLCTLAAFVMELIPVVREFSELPMLFALLAWLWWFGLLVWKTLRSGWRLAMTMHKPQ